jgi:hypothetical protein
MPSVVRRRRIVLTSNKKQIRTEELKRKELLALQDQHPEDRAQIQAAIDAGEFRETRVRKKHPLSEGESDEDSPVYERSQRSYFRALREDERPLEQGVRPPADHDATITARAHVTAGSRAKTKSPYVSASHSKTVASAWAAKYSKVVAQLETPDDPANFHDLMDPEAADSLGLKATGLNAAKGSQEVLIRGGVGPEYVKALYSAEPMASEDYERAGPSRRGSDEFRFRSRTITKDKADPDPVRVTKTYDREEMSEQLLAQVRKHWDSSIDRAVQAHNAGADAEQVDADDVADFLSGQAGTEDPNGLDYIQNDAHMRAYLAEIDDAIAAFLAQR